MTAPIHPCTQGTLPGRQPGGHAAAPGAALPEPATIGSRFVPIGLAFVLGAFGLLLAQQGWQRLAPLRPASMAGTSHRVDLNRADKTELMTLPGVGESLADYILEYRDQHGPFRNIEDLKQVNRVGQSLIDQLRPRLVIHDPATVKTTTRPVQAKPGDTSSRTSKSRKPLPDRPIDLNSATREQLMQLPNVGEVLAEQILADRQSRGPFQSVRDLTRVKGIKDKRLEELRPYLTVTLERPGVPG